MSPDDRSTPKYDTLLKLSSPVQSWISLLTYSLLIASVFGGLLIYFEGRLDVRREIQRVESMEKQRSELEQTVQDAQRLLKQQQEAMTALSCRVDALEIACKKVKSCAANLPK